MARRQVVEEPENLDRWLVSYADFITLLMAFFVVMYSISAVNEGKYKILSSTLSVAFNAPARSLDAVQVGELNRVDPVPGESIIDLLAGGGPTRPAPPVLEEQSKELAEIQASMEDLFQELSNDDLVEISGNELWVEVEMKSGLLFDSGSAYPSIDAEIILEEVANILRDKPNPVHVEGFTDNVPIRTEAYPSNWELSAARSAAIIRLLQENDVSPDRLAAVGFGEHQPVAGNDSEEGRSRNRRVVMVISRNMNIRRAVSGVGSDRAAENIDQIRELDARIAAGEQTEQEQLPPESAAQEPGFLPPEGEQDTELTESGTAVQQAGGGEPATQGGQDAGVEPLKPTVRAIRTEGGGLLFTRKPQTAEAGETAEGDAGDGETP